MESISNNKQLFNHLLLTGTAHFAAAVFSLNGIILVPILTKNLSISEYGVFVQLISIMGLILPLATLSLVPLTLVRYIAGEKNLKKAQDTLLSASTFVFLCSSFISVLIVLFSRIIITGFFANYFFEIVVIALILPFWFTSQVFLSYFRAVEDMKKYSGFLIFHTFSELLLISYFVTSGYALMSALLSILIVRILLFILTGYMIVTQIKLSKPKFSGFKEILTFSIPLIPSNLSKWIVDASDRYVIGIMLGSVFVGLYNPAYVLSRSIELFVTPFQLVLPVILTNNYEQGNLTNVQETMSYSLKYFLLLAVPAAVGLSLLAKPLLTILSTEETAINSFLVVPIVAASMIFQGVAEIAKNTLILKKNTKAIGLTWVSLALLNVFLNILLIPFLGIVGAAITTLFSYFLYMISVFYLGRKHISIHIEWTAMTKIALASFIMGLVIINLNHETLFNVLTSVFIGAMIYFTVLVATRSFSKNEISSVVKLVKK